VILWLLSLSCLAGVIWCLIHPPPRYDTTWNLLLTFSLGIWAATLYKLFRQLVRDQGSSLSIVGRIFNPSWRQGRIENPSYDKKPLDAALAVRRSSSSQPALPTEAVILWTALLAFTGLAAVRPGGATVTAEADAAGEGRPVAQLQEGSTWVKVFNDNGSGMIVSSPLVVDDRIYVAVAHQKGLDKFGVVHCLDRNTQEVLWSFDHEGDMKPVFSSPRLAEGRLFIGEGFHDDINCRLYCLDARTGKLCWPPFQTNSQTESSPCIVGGKVYFGAGNDGIYALDAATGKKLWQFPENPAQAPLLRVCASPSVAGGRLFAGSGIDRNRPQDPGETAVFCLDAGTGKLAWKVPVELPCWAAPVAAGEHVIFALGNGDVFEDARNPAGAVLCLEARSGRLVWRQDVPNGVLEKPAVDAHRVYFGSRDGHCYCLSRADGKELWKKPLGSPVVAALALDSCPSCGRAANVFAISTRGRVSCLDPYTGKIHWSYAELEPNAAHICSSPTVMVRHEPAGDRRRIYFGAAMHNLTVPALYCLEDLLPER
jgi:outer membrane protein assembly factor BamB